MEEELTPEEAAELAEWEATRGPIGEDDPLTPEEEAELAEWEATKGKIGEGATPPAPQFSPEEEQLALAEATKAEAAKLQSEEDGVLGTIQDFGKSITRGLPVLGEMSRAVDEMGLAGIPLELGVGGMAPQEVRIGGIGMTPEEAETAVAEEDIARGIRSPVASTIGEGLGALITPTGSLGAAKDLALGVGTSAADMLATGKMAEDPTLSGAELAAETGYGIGVPKVLGALGNTVGKISKYFDESASSQAQKAIGLEDTLKARKQLQEYEVQDKVDEFEIGKTLRDEGVVTAGASPKTLQSRLADRKAEIGEQIGEQIADAQPIASGKLRNELQKAIDGLAKSAVKGSEDKGRYLETSIKRIKRLEGSEPTRQQLEKLKQETMLDRAGLQHNHDRYKMLMMGADTPKAQAQLAELAALDGALEMIETNLNSSVMRDAADVAADKTTLGKDIKKFKSDEVGGKAGAIEEYKALAESLADAVPNKETYKALNKKYEIANFLEEAMERRAAGASDGIGDISLQAGLLKGDETLVALGTSRKLWRQFGNSFAAAGFGKASDLAGIPAKAAQALVEAANRGGAKEVRVSHWLMMQNDEDYRKARAKKQEKESE